MIPCHADSLKRCFFGFSERNRAVRNRNSQTCKPHAVFQFVIQKMSAVMLRNRYLTLQHTNSALSAASCPAADSVDIDLLRLQSLHSEDQANPSKLEVRAELLGNHGATSQLERLVSRISLEKGVSSLRWQVYELAAD